MKLLAKKGVTSFLVAILIQDSSSTTGAGLTGLTSGSSGFVCYRARADDGNAGGTQITLSAGTRGTWSSGGFVEKDSSNMPGVYELGIPNAALATGSDYAVIMLKGATNQAPLAIEIQLVAFDPDDAVHLGLSSLPNTAVTTNASLLTSGTGTDQLSVTSGRIDAGKWLGGTIPAVNVTGVPLVDLKYTLGTISPAAAGSVGIDWAQVANKGSTVSLTATTIATLTTYTGNTPQTADVATVKTQTDKLAFTVANQVDANALSINGNATAAANVAHTNQALTRGTVGAASSVTSITTSAITSPASVGASGQFDGRIILFDADTASANLQGQATNITGNTTGATPTFTVTALTTAPASGDKFTIV